MKMNKILAAMAASAISVSAFAAMNLSASAEKKDSYKFALRGQFGTENDWGDGHTVTVDKNGTYSIEWAVSQATETNNEDIILFIDTDVNIYDYAANENSDGITDGVIKFAIDSVTVDGVAQSYTFSEGSLRTDDGGSNMRLNLNNRFQGNVDLDGNFAVEDKIVVTFTVDGLFENADAEDTTTTTTTAPAAAAGTTTTTTAAAAAAGGTTTTKAAAAAAGTTTAAAQAAAATGDAGVGVVVAAVAVAGAAAYVSRKKND